MITNLKQSKVLYILLAVIVVITTLLGSMTMKVQAESNWDARLNIRWVDQYTVRWDKLTYESFGEEKNYDYYAVRLCVGDKEETYIRYIEEVEFVNDPEECVVSFENAIKEDLELKDGERYFVWIKARMSGLGTYGSDGVSAYNYVVKGSSSYDDDNQPTPSDDDDDISAPSEDDTDQYAPTNNSESEQKKEISFSSLSMDALSPAILDKYETVDNVKDALTNAISAQMTFDDIYYYDISYEDSFVSSGEAVTVTIAYPEGLSAEEFDFVVAHMISENANIELPAVRETADGIEVTLSGFSPVALAAKRTQNDSTGTSNTSSKNTANTEASVGTTSNAVASAGTSPETGEGISYLFMITTLMAMTLISAAGIGVIKRGR